MTPRWIHIGYFEWTQTCNAIRNSPETIYVFSEFHEYGMIASEWMQEVVMEDYPKVVEDQMVKFSRSLNERDRRRYAAVEAVKLGHGGLEYVSRLLGCDPKTIGQGVAELQSEEELVVDRQRKKGGGVNR